MSTTTIRLDDEMKARVSLAADRAGKSPHAFIVEAIADRVEQDELAEDLRRVADVRWADYLATGRTIAWDDMKTYLRAKAGGAPIRPPAARSPKR